METSTDIARDRLLDTVRTGDWARVPAEVNAYGAAVRADERKRVVDDAIEAISSLFDADPGVERAANAWRARCLAALERLY